MINWSSKIETSTNVDGNPAQAGATTGSSLIDWASIINKPATFAPSAHTHPWGEVSNTPTSLAGYGITDAYTKTASDGRYLRKDQDDSTSFNLTVQNITQDGSVPAGVGSFGSQYLSGMLDTNFTALANDDTIQYDSSTSKWLNTPLTTGTVSSWGDIGGTLSNQTDLQSALDTKVAGAIASPQIAYGTGANTIGGTSTFVYTGGKVGIGTSAPLATLQIGSISTLNSGELILARALNSVTNRMFKIGLDSGYNLSIGDNGNNALESYSPHVTIQYQDGKVGIGTVSPAYRLDVSGTGRFTSTVTATNFIQS